MGPGEECANPCRIRGADEATVAKQHHLTGLSISLVTRAERGALFVPLWLPWPPRDLVLLAALPPFSRSCCFHNFFLSDPQSYPSVIRPQLTERARRLRSALPASLQGIPSSLFCAHLRDLLRNLHGRKFFVFFVNMLTKLGGQGIW